MATTNTVPAMALPKAVAVRAAPVPPSVHTPVHRTTRAVMVQTMMVSTNTSLMPHRPCFTGWLAEEEEWASGAMPVPASLEYTPRARPQRMASITVEPAKPPVAAIGVKAYSKIIAKTCGMLLPNFTRIKMLPIT